MLDALYCAYMLWLFLFKQKTAYEMRISDWSSDVCSSDLDAVAAFQETDAGLVLADIQLADGSSGIDAVQDILAIAPVPAIFITAFPERLLTGGRVEPTFLISKPFRENTEIGRAHV